MCFEIVFEISPTTHLCDQTKNCKDPHIKTSRHHFSHKSHGTVWFSCSLNSSSLSSPKLAQGLEQKKLPSPSNIQPSAEFVSLLIMSLHYTSPECPKYARYLCCKMRKGTLKAQACSRFKDMRFQPKLIWGIFSGSGWGWNPDIICSRLKSELAPGQNILGVLCFGPRV